MAQDNRPITATEILKPVDLGEAWKAEYNRIMEAMLQPHVDRLVAIIEKHGR